MAKQEVLDAINATIAPNGIKGITAQSLNNVLTMMTENAGEGGSGDGALRVIVPELMMLGPEFINMGELSPATWEEMKPIIEADGIDASEYDAVVKAAFEHNVNVAQQIIAKAKAGQGVSVVLDQTPYYPAAFNTQFQMIPEVAALYEDLAMCVVQPAGLFMEYMKPTPEGEAEMGMVGELLKCTLNPLAPPILSEYSMLYPSNIEITLNLDGSLTFIPIEEEQPSSGSGVVTFYFAENFTDEIKAKNKAAYETYMTEEGTKGAVVYNVDSGATLFPVASHMEGDVLLFEIITTLFSENNTVESLLLPCHPDGTVEA